MNKSVIIVGAFHEIIELCEDCNCTIVGLIDNNLKKSYLGYPILGTDEDAPNLFKRYPDSKVVITPDLPSTRFKLAKYYKEIGFEFETIISPYARISKSANIGKGTVIQSGVNISSMVCLGDFVKVNTNANIMHDCKIGSYTTVAPNAVILGRVSIQENVYIGANSTILPEKIIMKNAIVGAGAVVTKNVVHNKTVKGIPAK